MNPQFRRQDSDLSSICVGFSWLERGAPACTRGVNEILELSASTRGLRLGRSDLSSIDLCLDSRTLFEYLPFLRARWC